MAVFSAHSLSVLRTLRCYTTCYETPKSCRTSRSVKSEQTGRSVAVDPGKSKGSRTTGGDLVVKTTRRDTDSETSKTLLLPPAYKKAGTFPGPGRVIVTFRFRQTCTCLLYQLLEGGEPPPEQPPAFQSRRANSSPVASLGSYGRRSAWSRRSHTIF